MYSIIAQRPVTDAYPYQATIAVCDCHPGKKKDPVLFTSGGPGNSSLGWINGMTKSSILKDRDCIAFEQRGTRFTPLLSGKDGNYLLVEEKYIKKSLALLNFCRYFT